MLEHETVPGVVESLKIITAENTRRLVTFAFNYAVENKRKKVTLVHKAVSISNIFNQGMYRYRNRKLCR